MASKRKRRIVGLLPRLGRGVLVTGRWLLRHPQPFMATTLIAASTWGLWSYAQHAEAFRVTQVELPAQSALKMPKSLVGTNLWALDLQRIAEELKRQAPWLKDVRVVRHVPNAIRIEPIARWAARPAAWTRSAISDANGAGTTYSVIPTVYFAEKSKNGWVGRISTMGSGSSPSTPTVISRPATNSSTSTCGPYWPALANAGANSSLRLTIETPRLEP